MAMRAVAPMVALGMALAACGTPDSDEARAEEAVEAPAFTPNPLGYIRDLGLIDGDLNAALSERLEDFHRETGHEIHIAVILTTDEQDVAEHAAEMIGTRNIGEDGALILVALADENIAIVPAAGIADRLPPDFVDGIEAEMAARFDRREIREGLTGAVDALTERLGE